MVHRKITENDNSILLRNVTIHDMAGLQLDLAAAIIASFSDNIKVTHKGKYIQVQ